MHTSSVMPSERNKVSLTGFSFPFWSIISPSVTLKKVRLNGTSLELPPISWMLIGLFLPPGF